MESEDAWRLKSKKVIKAQPQQHSLHLTDIILAESDENSDKKTADVTLSSDTEEEIFSFLKTLLHTLSVVLTSNAVNQAYFRDDIHFSTLSETLQSCHFIEGQRVVELCDCLLNMAVKG